MPEQQRQKVRTEVLPSLTADQLAQAFYDWRFWARDEQLPPLGEWANWLYLAGRGAGKTRTAGEWIRMRESQGYSKFALVGKTPGDVRRTMIEGPAGLLAISPPWNMPKYEPSKTKLTWPSGAYALTFSGAEPDQIRGGQFDSAWVDELAAFNYYQETWDNLQFGMRVGHDPRTVITTTPKPLKLLKDIVSDPATVTTRGSTYSNRLNLPDAFFKQIVSRYEGTRTGRQEIYAELLDEAEGALWQRAVIDGYRVGMNEIEL